MKAEKQNIESKENGQDVWQALRGRLEDAQNAITRGFEIDEESKRSILKSRAKALARKVEHTETGTEDVAGVACMIAGENYVIENQYIREVLPLKEITPLPCTPDFVSGVVNVRGEIFSVIDLKSFFDFPVDEDSGEKKIIVVEAAEMVVCFLADVIQGVQSVSMSRAQPSLPTLTGIRADYLKGITEERTAILNIERILSDKRIIVNETIYEEQEHVQ